MEYRGIEYTVVQGIERGTWKWTVTRDPTVNKSGQARNKSEAADKAEHATDLMLAVKRQRLIPPARTGMT
jgi:hypothetical protein